MMYKEIEDQKKAGMLQGSSQDMSGGMPMGAVAAGGMPMDMGAAAGGMPTDAATAGAPMEPGASAEQPAPQEAPVPQESLDSVSVINILGQDFLLENQKDFFKILKAVDDYNDSKKEIKEAVAQTSSLMEAIDNVVFGGDINSVMKKAKEKNMKKKTGKLTSQFINNEFGGLVFNEDLSHSLKVYKHIVRNNEDVFIESVIDI